MDPIRLFIRRPIFTSMLILALVVFGVFSFPKIGVDQLPDIDIPIVVVVTVLPGGDPETIEKNVTEPLEETLNTVPGLDRINSVVISRMVANPETYTPGTLPREVVLTIGWGAVQRLDLEPAGCSDPNCEADHGYTGSATADDLSLRVSEAGDGPETVAQALVFARALSEATVANG